MQSDIILCMYPVKIKSAHITGNNEDEVQGLQSGGVAIADLSVSIVLLVMPYLCSPIGKVLYDIPRGNRSQSVSLYLLPHVAYTFFSVYVY